MSATLTFIGHVQDSAIECFADNKAAYDLCHRFMSAQNSRHIDRKMFKMRELRGAGVVTVAHVGTEHNPAPARKRGLRSSDEGRPAGSRARVGVYQGAAPELGGRGAVAKRGGEGRGDAPPPVARRVSARGQQLGGAKRDFGEGSPSGSSVAGRTAVESSAAASRKESTRSRRALWTEAGNSRV